MNDFQKSQNAKILSCYKTEGELEISKSEILDLVKGGKKAFIGEKRTFGGREYIKTSDGWKFHGKGTGAKAQEHAAGVTSSIEIEGKVNDIFKPLINDFVKYNLDKLGISNATITLDFKPVKIKEIGFVDLLKVTSGENKVVVDSNASVSSMLNYISHELTHIKQILTKELTIEDGWFLWKGNKHISIKEYESLIKKHKFETYSNLPWERESFENQKSSLVNYKNSSNFSALKEQTTEPNLKITIEYL